MKKVNIGVELRLTALLSDLRARAGEGDSELLVS